MNDELNSFIAAIYCYC